MNAIHGLSSKEHITMQLDEHNARIQHYIQTLRPKSIIDLGAGSGHDSIMMRDFCRVNEIDSKILAIDSDVARIRDANQLFPKQFRIATDGSQVDYIFEQGYNLAYIGDDLPELPRMTTSALRADFILCHAVLMFIPAKDLSETFNRVMDLLSDDGVALFGFSTHRPIYHATDQKHGVELIDLLLQEEPDATVNTLPDLKDSQWHTNSDRQFHWHYRALTRKP